MKSFLRYQGFTLVELVIVIVILGILSVGITSFMGLGTSIYLDVSSRDEITASSRFTIERLNRELRNALPNSVREVTLGTNQCVEFLPIVASAIYQDIPVAPEAAVNQFDAIGHATTSLNAGEPYYLAAYVINANQAYNLSENRLKLIQGIDNFGSLAKWTIHFPAAVQFAKDSPTNRVYLVSSPVSYCANNGRMYRHQGYALGVDATTVAGVLMAEFLESADYFDVQQATQQRNSLVTVTLPFTRNDERVVFSNEVQVINVP